MHIWLLTALFMLKGLHLSRLPSPWEWTRADVAAVKLVDKEPGKVSKV